MWETEHCDYGCSVKDDKCCGQFERYNPETGKCGCDEAHGWYSQNDTDANYCVCKGGGCSSYKVGDYLTLGGKQLGKARIWRVLEVNEAEREMLVIFDVAHNDMSSMTYPFSSSDSTTTWEESAMHKYLNDLNANQNDSWLRIEQLLTAVRDNAVAKPLDGNDKNTDKVFLLSYSESVKYNAGLGYLRTPGETANTMVVTSVSSSGERTFADVAPTETKPFTPAMWLEY